jgi:hypothetical protein
MRIGTSELKIECKACSGTGLYRGCAEPQGVAVVCFVCGGSGESLIEYTPFTGRKRRNDVQYVQRSKGSFILNCGPTGQSITYDQFFNGELP